MLGKLIKNEIKMSAHMMMNIYVAAAVTIVIMLLAYAIDISWLSAMATIALFLIAMIALIITFVGVIANFVMGVFASRLMLMSLSRFKFLRNKKLYGGK